MISNDNTDFTTLLKDGGDNLLGSVRSETARDQATIETFTRAELYAFWQAAERALAKEKALCRDAQIAKRNTEIHNECLDKTNTYLESRVKQYKAAVFKQHTVTLILFTLVFGLLFKLFE